jgi:hypothetical protein
MSQPESADQIARELVEAAVRRFGAERAAALRPVIETTAASLAVLAAFAQDRDDAPAVGMDRGQ